MTIYCIAASHLNFLCHLSPPFPQSSPVLNTFHSPPLCVSILIFRKKYSSRTLTFSPWPTAPNLTLILLSPSQLMCIDVQKRISCLAELQELDYMSDVNWDAVLNKQLPPGFIPNASIRNYSSAKDETLKTKKPYVFRNTHSLYNILKEEIEASPPVGLSWNPDCVQSRLCV